jgi:benzoyl-CoA reductase/2-hydroxyglutaryl-CoA dehydratase subunit BcrC/BadD/HgdB
MNSFQQFAPERFANPLAAAQAAASRGSRIVGYIGDDIPVELILAASALPVRLEPRIGATPLADRYLESSFGPTYRSYLEQWLRGDLNFLDSVIFPRSNDTAQRLYYYVCELQRRGVCSGPRAQIYDLARIGRETSHQHTIAATRQLAEELGIVTGALESAIQRLRQRLSFARTLAGLRTSASAISGSDALQIWRALQLDWSEHFDAIVREWIAGAQTRTYARQLLFVGSIPPDERFHVASEAANSNIVDEIFEGSMSQSVARWDESASTIESIANAYRAARPVAPLLLDSPTLLADRVRNVGAHGVILWLIEEDEGIVWEVPRQLEQLRRAQIPVLALTRQRWDADAATLARITRFATELSTST